MPFWSVFTEKETERAFLAARRRDESRATALALFAGGLAYLGAGLTDGAVFAGQPDLLPVVRALRMFGVLLCFGGAALILRRRTTRSFHILAVIGMLGTLLTYSGIAYVEESWGGASDYRMVFSFFSLLAFIFFPLRVSTSLFMAAWMLANVTVLSRLLPARDPTELPRTLALMVTFAVAGASFSVTNNRARRKEFALRRRREEVLQRLSEEVAHRRRVELELEQHQRDLEGEVAARTEELQTSQRQLIASQRVESIGQLAGGLAHDFNNLLVAIMGNAQLTLETMGISPEVREYQENVMEAATRAGALARDLLAGGRRQKMEFEPIAPSELLQRMRKLLETAVGKRAELIIAAEPTATVNGARGPLEQVVLNLVLNARDATPPTGKIRLRTDSVEFGPGDPSLPPGAPAGRYVRLSVEDSGHGIAPEELGRIFEPFYSSKADGQGTGLGLSVARGVIEQHGGFLAVRSVVGEGTTFDVCLPELGESALLPRVSEKRLSPRGRESILIVDDDPLVARLARRTLEKAGYRVQVASGGEEALGLLSASDDEIGLVLADLVMPPMGGRRLMEKVMARGSSPPFLFSSGYSDGGVYREFLQEVGANFLAKPYSAEELREKVRQVLDGRLTGAMVEQSAVTGRAGE